MRSTFALAITLLLCSGPARPEASPLEDQLRVLAPAVEEVEVVFRARALWTTRDGSQLLGPWEVRRPIFATTIDRQGRRLVAAGALAPRAETLTALLERARGDHGSPDDDQGTLGLVDLEGRPVLDPVDLPVELREAATDRRLDLDECAVGLCVLRGAPTGHSIAVATASPGDRVAAWVAPWAPDPPPEGLSPLGRPGLDAEGRLVGIAASAERVTSWREIEALFGPTRSGTLDATWAEALGAIQRARDLVAVDARRDAREALAEAEEGFERLLARSPGHPAALYYVNEARATASTLAQRPATRPAERRGWLAVVLVLVAGALLALWARRSPPPEVVIEPLPDRASENGEPDEDSW